MNKKEAMDALIESGMDLRRDDIEMGMKLERERIIKDFESACRCNGEQTKGYFCEADWAIKIVTGYFRADKND